MALLRDPVVVLEEVRLQRISLAALDLEVTVRVENANPVGVTLRELPFSVLCSTGKGEKELASGNTGRAAIAARGITRLSIPVTSRNAAVVAALATFVMQGGVKVTIRGMAVIDAFLFSWSVPFEKTVPVTVEQVAGSLAGEGEGRTEG